tara:strand:+ start:3660 stop:5030 length:1371 start_codon:yes stop_codon:yes gene_type:complete
MEHLPNSGPNLSLTSQNNRKEEDPKASIDKKIEALLSQFSNAFKKTFDAQFEKGDIIIEIEQLVESRDKKAPELKELHNEFFSMHSLSYVSKLRTTALAYSAEERSRLRETGASFTDCYYSIDLCKRLKKTRQLPDSTPPSDVVELVRTSKKNSPKAIAKGIAMQIKATRDKNRMAEYQENIKSRPEEWWHKQFLKKDCRKLLSTVIKPGTVDLCWFDPPYLYRNGGRASPCLSECGLAETADNVKYEDALKLHLDMIRALPEYLSETGVVVLWGAGGSPDDPEVIKTAYESGFEYVFPLNWGKRTQAGHQYRGYGPSSERILILAKNREDLFDNNPELPRGQSVSKLGDAFIEKMEEGKIKSVTMGFAAEIRKGEAEPGDRSIYEKPLEICSGFVDKLTKRGGLVWDCCGCTGVMVEACLELQRNWIYSETNEINYALGYERTRRLIEKNPRLVG